MGAKPRVVIAGVATSQFARRIPDKSALQLRVEVAKAAADDAGLALKDVDGIILAEHVTEDGALNGNPRHHMEFSEILGLYETPLCVTAPVGGVSPGYSVEIGRWALQSGRCKYVLCVAGNAESSAGRTSRGNAMTDDLALLTMHYPDYEWPFGPLMPSYYALMAQYHMHRYGTTEEQLAAYPVAIRHNASLNPDAVYRTPITVDDVLSSKLISTPLHMLHCCMVNDGAVAFLMTTEERARELSQPPVYVHGSGCGMAGYWTGFLAGGGAGDGYSLTTNLARQAAADAFAEAGVGRDEIDFVTTCDNFAISPLIQLENYGFCEPGEGGAFAGPGGERIKVGGDLPVNPHGGLLSCNHAATNYQNYTEAVLQLRGQAGDRQVEGATLALATCSAGISSTHYATVLGSD
jgi:acetyl-CoA acetyltransferase